MNRPPVDTSSARQTPIAIIGMACLFPNAQGLKEYWRLIRRSEDAITEVPESHWAIDDYYDESRERPDRIYCRRGAFLSPTDFDPTEFGIPPATLEATDTAQLLGLVVGKKALQDAGYGPEREFDRTRASVILGVTGTQELVIPLGARLGHPIWKRALHDAGVAPDVAARVLEQISDSYVEWKESSFPGLLGNVVAGRVANRLDLKGTNCVVDAACASSLSATHLGVMELCSGRADLVLTGGVDTLNDIFMFMCFSKTQALSPGGDARPFSEDADGTVIGEGVGMLVLKRLADAERDGDRICAVLKGIGTSSDGRSQSIYAPHAEGQAAALRDAYRISGVSPTTVELLEAHGTGTKVGDVVEFDALKTVYGEADPDRKWCALGSVKSQIGHTKAAAGAASLVKSVLALHHKVLPATMKVSQPHPKLGLEDSPFYLSTETRPWLASADHPRRAAVSSFGFGGSNFHAVLEEYPAADPEPAWDGSVEIVALSAATLEQLNALLDEWQKAAAEGLRQDELARKAAESRTQFCGHDAYRLALVVEYGDDLAKLIAAAKEGLLRRGSEQAWNLGNVFFGGSAEPGEIAFLFPGQGSQYVGMCRDVVCVFPEARAAVEAANETLADGELLASRIYPQPVFDDEQRAGQESALTRTEVAQPALGAVSLAMLRVLGRFGIKPHFVAGHSYGELVALHAAGCITEDDLRKLSRIRGELMAEGDGGRGGAMLAVHAPLAEIERVLEEEDFDVELANRNSPTQGILSGSRAAIERVARFLDRKGWRTRLLQVSAAFHSKLMAQAEKRFRAALDMIPFASGKIPVFANCTGQPYPLNPEGMRHLLADQLTRPVMFMDEIKNLYDAGVRTFVEVGPKKVLTGLANSILQGKPHHALATDGSFGRAAGIADVARVVAILAILGHSVELAGWEQSPSEPTTPNMAIALLGANYRAPSGSAPATDNPRSSTNKETGNSTMHDTATRNARRATPAQPASIESTGVPRPPNLADQAAAAPPGGHSRRAGAPPAPVADAQLSHALQVVQEGLRSMQLLQQQTAAAHQRFLEGQEKAHDTLCSLTQRHQQLVERALGLSDSAPATAPALPADDSAAAGPAPAPTPETVVTTPAEAPASLPLEVEPPIPIADAAAPSTADRAVTPAGDGDGHSIASALLHAVSATTGHPLDTIHLDMELEADLGLDRVRRVDVLSGLRTRIPALPAAITEQVDRFRTLREIVEFAQDGPHAEPQPPPAATPEVKTGQDAAQTSADGDGFAQVMLEVVAELTGYPVEMLDLDMDMEADLGIDSIKRLEILSSVQRRLPQLAAVDSQYMGSLRTLRNILDYILMGAEMVERHAERSEASCRVREQIPRCARNDNVQHFPLAVISAPADAPAASDAASGGAPPDTPAPAAAAEPAGPPVDLDRRVLRVVDLPAATPGSLRIAPGHEIWVTDDGAELALALARGLTAAGLSARVVTADEQIDKSHEAPVGGLIHLASPTRMDGLAIAESSQRFLKTAFALTRAVGADLRGAAARGGALFVTIARLDGAFGLSGGPFDPVQGGLAGLAKTVADEWPDVDCRALDVAGDWGDTKAISTAILNELSADSPREVGLSETGRRGLELTSTPASAASADPLRTGEVVVVSGGARGVTAEATLALARAERPTLILLGRSPEPAGEPACCATLQDEAAIKRALLENAANGRRLSPAELERAYRRLLAGREIRRNLDRLKAAGARVLYRPVDVRDAQAVAALLEDIRRTEGPIRGIIHGAGVIADHRIEDKTNDAFDRVFDTKVRGLAALLAATAADDLKCVALFSSVSGRFGRRGQVDYAMANEVLNKVAHRIAALRPACRVVSINWGPWDGGMVSCGLKREFARLGIGLIPLRAGAEALVRELCIADRSAVEVVIGAALDESISPRPRSRPVRARARSEELALAFERRLDIDRHPFLNSHVIAGQPVLPVAMMLEWLGHGALHANPGLLLHGFDDLRVLKGVILKNGPRELRVVASKARRSGDYYELDVELRSGPESAEVLNARARAVLAERLPAPPALEHSAELEATPYPRDIDAAYGEVLFHGPALYGIARVRGHSARGISAEVKPAPAPSVWMAEPPRSEWLGDPLVLDAGLQLGLLWAHEHLGVVGLPNYAARYCQYQPEFPRAGMTALLEVREQDAQRLVADITFADANRQVVARVQGSEWTVDPSLNKILGRRAAACT